MILQKNYYNRLNGEQMARWKWICHRMTPKYQSKCRAQTLKLLVAKLSYQDDRFKDVIGGSSFWGSLLGFSVRRWRSMAELQLVADHFVVTGRKVFVFIMIKTVHSWIIYWKLPYLFFNHSFKQSKVTEMDKRAQHRKRIVLTLSTLYRWVQVLPTVWLMLYYDQ